MIIEAIQEKNGSDIVLMDLKGIINAPCSFFIISSAKSKTQINAIANNIEKALLEKLNIKIWNQEGRLSSWRLIDYLNIVIHIFQDKTRKHYNLEELWGDALIKKIQ